MIGQSRFVVGIDLGTTNSAVAFVDAEEKRARIFSIPQLVAPGEIEARETLPVDYTGDAMQICFNAQYVLDFLSVVSTDLISLELKDEVSQAVMKPVGAEGYDYTYVIMPMLV